MAEKVPAVRDGAAGLEGSGSSVCARAVVLCWCELS